MSGRTEPVRGRKRVATSCGLAVRALIVTVIGLVLGELDSGIAVILTNYGLLFLLGIGFLGLRARSLAVLSGMWLLVVPLLSQLVRAHLPGPSYASPQLGGLSDPWQLLTELTLTGYYPVLPWLAYLLAGMAIGRLDLTRTRTALELLVPGVLLAAASWFLSSALLQRPDVLGTLRRTYDGPADATDIEELLAHGLYGTTPTGSWDWLAVRAPHSGTPFDLAHTIGSAVVVISVCLLLSRLAPRALAVLFGAGTMTLTLYSAHVVLRTQLFWPDDSVATFAQHVAFVLCAGALFRLARARGPVETVVAKSAGLAAEAVRVRPSSMR